ncbi:Fe-S cluster assembly protein SufB [Candidatus Uhrbacteria bacterium]|nr:Fe-S cluster assembly protein SufB [Candidatus Uhrbacteria bacterium]
MPVLTKEKATIKRAVYSQVRPGAVQVKSVFRTPKGLNEDIVSQISERKNEPDWMRDLRIAAYGIFRTKKMPTWGPNLSKINFDAITYYLRPQEREMRSWDDVPAKIKETFDKLGIPQAERKFLAGAGAQWESEVVYHSLQESLKKQGVIFESMDEGLRKYPYLVRQYFGKIVPARDNKFAALNTAAWSGGSFVYVPKGVSVALPLQAYFRINEPNMGQFERTLIIAEEGSSVHYVEGCSAPRYTKDSLHSAVVEIFVKKHARVQYTTIQNWSGNVFNLVTKRAVVYEGGEMFWLDCNLGSKITMKYPSIILREPHAKGEILSFAYAGRGQRQDAGGKVIHCAPHTSSTISSRSVSNQGGRSSYRGLVKVAPGAHDATVSVTCDALMLDSVSRSDTYPTIDIAEEQVSVAHEARVNRISEEALFYLMSRGLSQGDATSLLVNGFAQAVIKKLPMEYAIELHRLLTLETKGGIG